MRILKISLIAILALGATDWLFAAEETKTVSWTDSTDRLLGQAIIETMKDDEQQLTTITVSVANAEGDLDDLVLSFDQGLDTGVYVFTVDDPSTGWSLEWKYETGVSVTEIRDFGQFSQFAEELRNNDSIAQMTVSSSGTFFFQQAVPLDLDVDLTTLFSREMDQQGLKKEIPASTLERIAFLESRLERTRELAELESDLPHASLMSLLRHLAGRPHSTS